MNVVRGQLSVVSGPFNRRPTPSKLLLTTDN